MDQFFAAALGSGYANPLELFGSNLIAWYRADVGVYKDAGTTLAADTETVQQWNDQSGNGCHLLQNTAGNRPTYQAAGFNSRKTVLFTVAATSYMAAVTPTVPMGTGSAGSGFAVCQMLTGTSSNGRAFVYKSPTQLDTDANSAAWILRNGTNNAFATYQSGFKASTNISLATNYRLGIIFDGANVTSYTNNVAGTPAASSHSWLDAGRIDVGATGVSYWEGPISEIVVTKTALDGTERTNLDNWFTQQWGL